MQKYLEERIQFGDFRILGFAVSHYTDEIAIYGIKQMAQGLALICKYMTQRYPEYVFFNLRLGYFALVGPASMDFDRLRSEIDERFRQPWQADGAELHLNGAFVHASAASGIRDAGRIVDSILLAMLEIGARRTTDNSVLDLDHSEDIEREMAVKRALDHAVATNHIEMFLQPIMDSASGELVAAEALARLRDENGNLNSPPEFISLAEKNGQINRLGDLMAENVCAFLRAHGGRQGMALLVGKRLQGVGVRVVGRAGG